MTSFSERPAGSTPGNGSGGTEPNGESQGNGNSSSAPSSSHDSASELAQALRDLARGERAATALEANLTNLENKLDDILAAFEQAAGPVADEEGFKASRDSKDGGRDKEKEKNKET